MYLANLSLKNTFISPIGIFLFSLLSTNTLADTPSSSVSLAKAPQKISLNAISDSVINPDRVITFSEFSVDSPITNQYADKGIIFGGDSPFISLDSSNPTAPVLSGSPRFEGAIEGRFVDPNDGASPVLVAGFSLDAGYLDAVGSVRLVWFAKDGKKK
ncbi:MAG: hypothetical protein IPG06_16830 [Haliea sp.]|nr:hypothetical protein [Haliea sp.]